MIVKSWINEQTEERTKTEYSSEPCRNTCQFHQQPRNPKCGPPEALSLNISLQRPWAPLYFNWRGGYSKPCTLILLFFSWISDYEINQQSHSCQELLTCRPPTLPPKQEKGNSDLHKMERARKGIKGGKVKRWICIQPKVVYFPLTT